MLRSMGRNARSLIKGQPNPFAGEAMTTKERAYRPHDLEASPQRNLRGSMPRTVSQWVLALAQDPVMACRGPHRTSSARLVRLDECIRDERQVGLFATTHKELHDRKDVSPRQDLGPSRTYLSQVPFEERDPLQEAKAKLRRSGLLHK